MKKIALYGAGGLGHEVAAAIRNRWVRESEDWEIIGYFDDRDFSEAPGHHLLGRWLGGIEALNSWAEPIGVILCFGSPGTRLAVADKIQNPLVEFPNCISSDFKVSDTRTFTIGHGNVIQGRCVATSDVTVGNFNLLNGSVALGHDVTIGDGNVVMPGCRISGEVSIKDRNLLGAMSFIKQGLKVGSEITLSPLSALLTKPKDGNTYIGNPAKIFKF